MSSSYSGYKKYEKKSECCTTGSGSLKKYQFKQNTDYNKYGAQSLALN